MHGQPRRAPKPEDAAELSAKTEKLRSLQSQFLDNHRNCIYTKEALDVSAKLLEINPECYTAWNYRKLAVQHYLSQSESESDPDAVKNFFDLELKVVESALRQNFKSYGAWHHRKWVLSKGHSSIDQELRLLDRFQKADARNFHAWNYRRFVAALLNRSDEDELKYTEEMIDNNFSNYSAWHNRSVLLSNLLKRKAEGYFPKETFLGQEYERVYNALFTDPDDQSGWFYHLWLLDQTVKSDSPLLVSCWPPHGSNVIIQGNIWVGVCGLPPLHSVISETGKLPIVLYFNQAVQGVNSSTVTVTSELDVEGDILWKPLSTNNSRTAQVWVTYLSLPDGDLHSMKNYLVEISMGYSHGIISSSGFNYSPPSRYSFEVCLQTTKEEHAGGKCEQMISWSEHDFRQYKTHVQDSGRDISVFQLTMKDVSLSATSNWQAEIISNEISQFRDLLSSDNCKLGKLSLSRLLTAYYLMLSSANNGVHYEEILELYVDLMKMDPSHSSYYKDEHSEVLLQQITSSRESFLRHCYLYGSLEKSTADPVCLRLHNLSLSRVGSFEKLLWVQVLDLSHNELQSVEGLEALQLLARLNLSHNKLRNFTALGPVRLLKSLTVLNITYNQIGSHSIDTTRYLCPSPLSHTEKIVWDDYEPLPGDLNVKKYWDLILVFKGLNLLQVDIEGNPVVDENMRLLLPKVLPTLKWLDGTELH